MPHPALEAEFLFSIYGDDPDLADLVAMFVEEMPGRIERLENGIAALDRPLLGTAAHQLKGAGGSYGFHQLTPFAARVEDAVKMQLPEAQLLAATAELLAICRKLRAGVAEKHEPRKLT